MIAPHVFARLVHGIADPTSYRHRDTGTLLLRPWHRDRSAEELEENSASLPPSLLQSRLQDTLRADVAVTADLRLLVRGSMDALRATLGEQGWQAAVETVEPVVLRELQRMVA